MRSGTHRPDGAATGQGAGARSTARAAVDAALAGMSADFHHFVSDLEDLVQATTTLSGEDLVRAKAKLSARVAAARESLEQIGGAVSDRSRKTIDAANSYVHDEPWTVIAVSAAAALLVGFLLGRRGPTQT